MEFRNYIKRTLMIFAILCHLSFNADINNTSISHTSEPLFSLRKLACKVSDEGLVLALHSDNTKLIGSLSFIQYF